MILINGKPEAGTEEFPQSGFYLNEEQTLDDSFETQISQVYKHLNNLIIVANQHGTLINQVVKRERDQAKGNDILKGLEEASHCQEFKNTTFQSLMNSGLENKANEMTNSQVGNSLKGLKSTLQGICYAHENVFDASEIHSTRIEQLEKKLAMIEEKKCDKSDVKEKRIATKTEIRNELSSTADRLDEKMTTIEKEVETKMNSTLERLGELQKETLWKIKDCEEKLKIRPTEKYVTTCVSQVEDTIDQKVTFMLKNSQLFENV